MERIIQKVKPTIGPALKMRNVCAYARVSSGKDAMLHSLSAQVSYYQTFIQSHSGWKFCGIYADEALTGTKENRTQFQAMLAECRKGNIDLIITKSISRFARNTITLLQTVRELKNIGVEVFFEEQNIYSLSTEGEVMLTILASYAQEESLSTSENTKWRIRKGYENGELLQWRFLYGYEITKGHVAINKEQACVVREIFDRFISGQSIGEIRRWLNDSEIKGLFGGEWNRARIINTLKNEKYIGDILCQKRFVNNHLGKKIVLNRGQLPKYYIEGTHPGIIDREVFEKAQRMLTANSLKYGWHGKTTASPFSGKMKCGNCGSSMRRAKRNGFPLWVCPVYFEKGKKYCPRKGVRADILDETTKEVIATIKVDEEEFFGKLESIAVFDDLFRYTLDDGTQIEAEWHNKSRSESWTPEMREKARQIRYEQGEKKCRK